MAINDRYFESLKELYVRCCNEADVDPGSFLKKAIGSTKNKIYGAVIKSKYDAGIYDSLATSLLEEGYIRSIDNHDGQYTITAKGVWAIEEKYYGQNISDIIGELDSRFFSSESERINDKNKIILFATIAAHAFSENNGISYASGAEKAFINMMEESFELLYKLKRIKISSFESIFKSKNSQKKDEAVLTSSIDSLPRSTYSLFMSKKNRYYVNLLNNQTIDKNELKCLLKIIFENIGVGEIEMIMESCKTISLNYGYYYHKDYILSDSEYNEAIESSLVELAGL